MTNNDRIPNTLKVGEHVYFVVVPWGKTTPEIVTRTITQSSQKQITLNGYGPNGTSKFWIHADGTPRHGDYHGGAEPCFYTTKSGALRAFERQQREAVVRLRKAIDEAEQYAEWAAMMQVTP